jgi:hypothetical protein
MGEDTALALKVHIKVSLFLNVLNPKNCANRSYRIIRDGEKYGSELNEAKMILITEAIEKLLEEDLHLFQPELKYYFSKRKLRF